MSNEDFDIYGDLEDFDLNERIKLLENEIIQLKKITDDKNQQIDTLKAENTDLSSKNKLLLNNISSVVKTAKAELSRKDRVIEQLKNEKLKFTSHQNKSKFDDKYKNNSSQRTLNIIENNLVKTKNSNEEEDSFRKRKNYDEKSNLDRQSITKKCKISKPSVIAYDYCKEQSKHSTKRISENYEKSQKKYNDHNAINKKESSELLKRNKNDESENLHDKNKKKYERGSNENNNYKREPENTSYSDRSKIKNTKSHEMNNGRKNYDRKYEKSDCRDTDMDKQLLELHKKDYSKSNVKNERKNERKSDKKYLEMSSESSKKSYVKESLTCKKENGYDKHNNKYKENYDNLQVKDKPNKNGSISESFQVDSNTADINNLVSQKQKLEKELKYLDIASESNSNLTLKQTKTDSLDILKNSNALEISNESKQTMCQATNIDFEKPNLKKINKVSNTNNVKEILEFENINNSEKSDDFNSLKSNNSNLLNDSSVVQNHNQSNFTEDEVIKNNKYDLKDSKFSDFNYIQDKTKTNQYQNLQEERNFTDTSTNCTSDNTKSIGESNLEENIMFPDKIVNCNQDKSKINQKHQLDDEIKVSNSIQNKTKNNHEEKFEKLEFQDTKSESSNPSIFPQEVSSNDDNLCLNVKENISENKNDMPFIQETIQENLKLCNEESKCSTEIKITNKIKLLDDISHILKQTSNKSSKINNHSKIIDFEKQNSDIQLHVFNKNSESDLRSKSINSDSNASFTEKQNNSKDLQMHQSINDQSEQKMIHEQIESTTYHKEKDSILKKVTNKNENSLYETLNSGDSIQILNTCNEKLNTVLLEKNVSNSQVQDKPLQECMEVDIQPNSETSILNSFKGSVESELKITQNNETHSINNTSIEISSQVDKKNDIEADNKIFIENEKSFDLSTDNLDVYKNKTNLSKHSNNFNYGQDKETDTKSMLNETKSTETSSLREQSNISVKNDKKLEQTRSKENKLEIKNNNATLEKSVIGNDMAKSECELNTSNVSNTSYSSSSSASKYVCEFDNRNCYNIKLNRKRKIKIK